LALSLLLLLLLLYHPSFQTRFSYKVTDLCLAHHVAVISLGLQHKNPSCSQKNKHSCDSQCFLQYQFRKL